MSAIRTRSLALIITLLSTTVSQAQLIRPFVARYSGNVRGAMTFVSNSILQSGRAVPGGCGYTPPATDPMYTDPLPGASNGNLKNDEYVGAHIDIDGDPSTLNSSAARLTLPSCSNIAFAGLYWGVGIAKSQGNGCAASGNTPLNAVSNWNQVKFKAPGSAAYTTLTADRMDTVTNIFHFYQGFKDVTSLVQSAGAGYYTIADVKCPTGKVNTFGGWTLVVVYENASLAVQNIVVYDGAAVVGTSGGALSQVDFSVTGFLPPVNGPVNARMGVVCYDGDRNPADGFRIRDTTGAYIEQSAAGESAAATSNANDVWNSSISIDGANVTSRNPAYANTYGYDADIFKLANTKKRYIRNGDSTLNIRLNTASEGYILTVMASRIDAFQPFVQVEDSLTDLNGGALQMGDTLLVTSYIRNNGSDTAQNVIFTDSLAQALKYVAGSLKINGAAATDAGNDDAGEYLAATQTVRARVGAGAGAGMTQGGRIRNLDTAVYTIAYRLTVSASCTDIGPAPVVVRHSTSVTYTGQESATTDTARSRAPAASGCVQPVLPQALAISSSCVTLLVVLTSFTATESSSGGALLNWTTQNNDLVRSFSVSASPDGRSFTPVADVPAWGAGGSADYALTDTAPYQGGSTTFYRLRVELLDGTAEFSPLAILRRTGATDAGELLLAPNPARNLVQLTLPARATPAAVRAQLFDATGRAIRELPFSAMQQTVSVADLAPGMYLIRYQDGVETRSYRLVVE